MHRRVFVAINLNNRTLNAIEELVNECRQKLSSTLGDAIRFSRSKNLHITLSFLGHQDEDAVSKITHALGEVAEQFEAQEVVFDRLLYGPPGRTPHMIWLLANEETSASLGKIKTVFEEKLDELGINFNRETRRFSVHITLARFSEGLKSVLLPEIDKAINIQFEAKELDLMESELKRGGAEYTSLQKYSLL